MKIEVTRQDFLKVWQMAERCSSSKSTMSSLNGVLIKAEGDHLSMEATDLKTSIKCGLNGVSVIRNGTAILPVKILGELFKKTNADTFIIEVKNEKGIFSAGRNKTRFTTWPVDDFPTLRVTDSAEKLCDIAAADLMKILTGGSIASSPTDDFPKYTGACMLQVKDGLFHVISTDGHRLSLAKCSCQNSKNTELLLPVLAVRELQRLIGGLEPETTIEIFCDASQAWFKFGEVEFSARRVESTFPVYEKILNSDSTTNMLIDREEFLAALDRISILVKSYTRLVVMYFSPGGQLKITGKAPELGTATEMLDAEIDGEPLRVGFNVTFLQDGLKALDTGKVKMVLNGEIGQMKLYRDDSLDFLYMSMPVRVTEQDMVDSEEEYDFDDNQDQSAEK